MEEIKRLSSWKLIVVTGLAWMFDAMDIGMLSFIIAALKDDWALNIKEMAWIGSMNSIGMAVGALAFGLLADRIGRKNVIMMTLVLFSIGSGLSAFTGTLSAFLVLRFFVGMGLGGELPVAVTLVSESVAPEKRGRIIVLLESFWACGWLLAAIISYFIIPSYGWRTAMLISLLPAFYAFYLRVNLPDSPQFQTLKRTKPPSMLANIKTVWSKAYFHQTLMLWILWFCFVFSYYGMFLWLPSVMRMKGFSLIASFEYVLIMTLAQLPGYFSAAWLIEKIGRKFVLTAYLLGSAISAYFFGTAESLAPLLIAGIFLSFFNLGAWGALYVYTPEQYPAAIRGTGAGMAASFGRLGGILGPLCVGYLVAADFSINSVFLIFCAALLIGILSVLILGEETKGMSLETI